MFFSLTGPPHFCSPRSYSFRVLTACSVSSPSCFTLSVFCKNSQKINPVLSYSCALFKNECFANSSTINDFRALCKSPGVYPQRTEIPTHSVQRPTANPFRIHTSKKLSRNSFRICTSKTQHLKSFRIRTYGKTRGGVGVPAPLPYCSVVHLRASSSILRAAP
jgi:hypothetical protein